MPSLLHDVLATREQLGWSNLDDFDLGLATPAPARMVIDQPGWSLYSLDHARDLAVFVQLPDGTDLADSAFAYATQVRLARRVLTMPLAELEAVADLAPPVPRVILVFSAAGFTGSASWSGDKLSTLSQIMALAMQHGMVWVGLGLKPGNNHSKGSNADLNRVGSFLGAMAQANADQGVEGIAPSDFATMEALGKRVAEVARRHKAGSAELARAA